MSDSRSVIFGNIQYQISKPVRHQDGYYYQRVRQLDRDGKLVGQREFIARSARPDSEDGLFDPNGGRQAAYAAGRSAFDAGRIAVGARLRNRQIVNGGIADIVRGATQGFPLPGLLQAEHGAWPGTDEPWDEKTLNSDSHPTWQPGSVEKFFYGDTHTPPNPAGKHTPGGPVSNSGAPPATPAFRPAGTGGVLGRFLEDGVIAPAGTVSSSLPGPTAPNFANVESAFDRGSGNAPGAPRPATYRVSSAFRNFTPRDLDQPMPPLDQEQEQADMRALEAKFLSSGNINDAVALYNARKLGVEASIGRRFDTSGKSHAYCHHRNN